MKFVLLTPEYTYKITNPIRIKGYLKNGIVEVFDKHQYLMGLVENNLVEVESNLVNKIENFFVLQNGVFIVSNVVSDIAGAKPETVVYVYAKAFFEVGHNAIENDLLKKYEQKNGELKIELEKLNKNDTTSLDLVLNSRTLILQEDVDFLRNVLLIIKKLKGKDN